MQESIVILGVRVRRLVLLLVSVILLSPLSLADVNVELNTDNLFLTPGTYTLKIETNRTDTYGLTALGPYRSWVVFSTPYVTVRNYGEVNFSITPPEGTKAGKYRFPILIYSLSNESFYIKKTYELIIEEFPEATISITTNKVSCYPGEKVIANIKVKNSGTVDFDELKLIIKFSGGGYEKTAEKIFSLNMGEERNFTETFETSFSMVPGTYLIEATLIKFGERLDYKKRYIELETVNKIEKNHTSSWNGIQESGKFYLKNVGNVERTEKISMEVSKPWDWFVYFSEEPQIKSVGGKTLYTWSVTLKPGEEKTIYYEIHYYPFIVIVFLLLFAGYVLLRQIKKPVIRKYSIQTKVLEDDRREVMVALEVKSGCKKMKDVVVEDTLPPIAQLIKDFKTRKPKILKTDRGVKLKWNLGDLSKNENIILTYRFKTMIGSLDYIRLPKAVLKAKIKNMRHEYKSNSLKIKD